MVFIIRGGGGGGGSKATAAAAPPPLASIVYYYKDKQVLLRASIRISFPDNPDNDIFKKGSQRLVKALEGT